MLDVVAQQEVEERPSVGGQLQRGGQPALDDGEVARGQHPVEVVDVGVNLEPVYRKLDVHSRSELAEAISRLH
jgi:hypothetical protein